MPYLIASILAITSAMVILLTRYEADDSLIKVEIEKVKNMYSLIDSYVNVYIQSGGNLLEINFKKLYDDGILPANVEFTEDATNPNASKISFVKSDVYWQMLSTDGSSYKLLVDMSQNRALMNKAIFAESFTAREFCEKLLFGSVVYNDGTNDIDGYKISKINATYDDFEVGAGSSKEDGIYQCVVYK